MDIKTFERGTGLKIDRSNMIDAYKAFVQLYKDENLDDIMDLKKIRDYYYVDLSFEREGNDCGKIYKNENSKVLTLDFNPLFEERSKIVEKFCRMANEIGSRTDFDMIYNDGSFKMKARNGNLEIEDHVFGNDFDRAVDVLDKICYFLKTKVAKDREQMRLHDMPHEELPYFSDISYKFLTDVQNGTDMEAVVKADKYSKQVLVKKFLYDFDYGPNPGEPRINYYHDTESLKGFENATTSEIATVMMSNYIPDEGYGSMYVNLFTRFEERFNEWFYITENEEISLRKLPTDDEATMEWLRDLHSTCLLKKKTFVIGYKEEDERRILNFILNGMPDSVYSKRTMKLHPRNTRVTFDICRNYIYAENPDPYKESEVPSNFWKVCKDWQLFRNSFTIRNYNTFVYKRGEAFFENSILMERARIMTTDEISHKDMKTAKSLAKSIKKDVRVDGVSYDSDTSIMLLVSDGGETVHVYLSNDRIMAEKMKQFEVIDDVMELSEQFENVYLNDFPVEKRTLYGEQARIKENAPMKKTTESQYWR